VLVVPFRGIDQVVGGETLPFRTPPQRISRSFRVLSTVKYRGYWFRDPALPLAISSAVRFSFTGPRWAVRERPVHPLVELGLPPESRTT